MKFSSNHTYLILALLLIIIILFFPLINNQKIIKAYAASPIQHVFVIAMENHDWRDIKGSPLAPYINSLLTQWSHAEQYYNPPGTHPSAPNYVWLEAGAAVAGSGDCKPTDSGCSSSANHLSKQLDAAGISWREYAEDATGTSCILDFSSVDVNHVGFSYFTDVTNNNNPNSSNCITHERPYTQLTTDLQNNSVARYSFITPNLNDDMHNGTIQQGDTWLSQQVPKIMNSQAYKNDGVIFITWDEGEGDDGPIGMIVISPFAKKNYTNSIHYDHGSTLKTLEEIFGVSPFLGNAAAATDLSDFFTVPLNGTGGATAAPTNITPTLFCLGGICPTTPSPTKTVTAAPTNVQGTPAPTQNPCVTTANKGIVHALKERKRINGALGNLLLLFLQFLIQLLQQLLGGGNVVGPPTNPIPTINPTTNPSISPCATPSIQNTTPGTTINPPSSSSLGPKTKLHYTANGNFSGNTYLPGSVGFNIADVTSLGEINNLPNGVKGLVYLNTCSGANASFKSTVKSYFGNAKVFGFFLIDEPDPTGQYHTLCTAANLKAESDWIHQNDTGAKTFIVVMNMSSSKTPTYMNTYNPSNSDIDLYGIDAYPCRTDYNGCDFTIVKKNISAATAAGLPIADIVPVYQTFGGGSWKTDGGGSYIMPSANQETQLLSIWAAVVPNPVFDYAYSWGTQNGDQALAGDSSLQQVFATHNK